MKKGQKYIVIFIVILFILVVFSSSFPAKKETNQKATSLFDGHIIGKTEYIFEGKTKILPYVKIKIDNIIGRFTISNSNGEYSLRVKSPYPDGYYTLVASSDKIIKKDGKYYEILPQTEKAIVNFRVPTDYVDFKLECKETTNKEKIKNSDIIDFNHKSKEIKNNGKIYGHTVKYSSGSWNPISYVKVKANYKITISAMDGYYTISDLPLNEEIKITASKFGYFSDTKTVTLTDENPEEYILLDVQPIIKNSKGKSIDFLRGLLSSTLFSANTRPNFFSTFTFVS